jgi:hypothetical protein
MYGLQEFKPNRYGADGCQISGEEEYSLLIIPQKYRKAERSLVACCVQLCLLQFGTYVTST